MLENDKEKENLVSSNEEDVASPKMQSVHQEGAIDKLHKPMGAFNYIGTFLLFAIPILGFCLALVWSFAPVNTNRKNLSRAILVFKILGIILLAVFYFFILPAVITPILDLLYAQFLNNFTNPESANELLTIYQDAGYMNSTDQYQNFNLNSIDFNSLNLNVIENFFNP